LKVPGDSGFATVMAVSLDGRPLAKSTKILLSKTFTDASGLEGPGPDISLFGALKGSWAIKATRPAGIPELKIENSTDGSLKIPASRWNECELSLP